MYYSASYQNLDIHLLGNWLLWQLVVPVKLVTLYTDDLELDIYNKHLYNVEYCKFR